MLCVPYSYLVSLAEFLAGARFRKKNSQIPDLPEPKSGASLVCRVGPISDCLYKKFGVLQWWLVKAWRVSFRFFHWLASSSLCHSRTTNPGPLSNMSSLIKFIYLFIFLFTFLSIFWHCTDHVDEDSPKWPWVLQSHIYWSSQYGSEGCWLRVALHTISGAGQKWWW